MPNAVNDLLRAGNRIFDGCFRVIEDKGGECCLCSRARGATEEHNGKIGSVHLFPVCDWPIVYTSDLVLREGIKASHIFIDNQSEDNNSDLML